MGVGVEELTGDARPAPAPAPRPRSSSPWPISTAPHAAATAAWPKEIPPSLGGRRSGTSTRRPAASRRAAVDARASRTFWKTPPESTASSVPRPRRDLDAGPGRRVGQRAVEARGHDAGADPGGHVAGDRADRLARVEHRARADRERVGAALVRVAGRLELGRRLALVGHGRAQAAQRGDGVEQPARARRHRRGGAAPGEPARSRASARRRPRPRARAGSPAARPVGAVARRDEPRARHPPRLAHGLVAARQAHRVQVAGAARSRRRPPTSISPPHTVPSGPRPLPSKIAPTAGPVSPCSARQAARCAWWCWTATCSTPSRASA